MVESRFLSGGSGWTGRAKLLLALDRGLPWELHFKVGQGRLCEGGRVGMDYWGGGSQARLTGPRGNPGVCGDRCRAGQSFRHLGLGAGKVSKAMPLS